MIELLKVEENKRKGGIGVAKAMKPSVDLKVTGLKIFLVFENICCF